MVTEPFKAVPTCPAGTPETVTDLISALVDEIAPTKE